MPFNIASPFLSKHGIAQLHSQGCIRFQNNLIPLLPRSDAQTTIRSTEGIVITSCEVLIPAHSEVVIPRFAPTLQDDPNTDIELDGCPEFMGIYNLHPLRGAVVTSVQGQFFGKVVNSTDSPVTIK
jgi:hypothetical protein